MSGRGFQANVLQFVRNVVQDRSEEEATIDLQVGKTVHSDVPRHMRTELWMSVLLRKGIGTAAAQQYREMLKRVSLVKESEGVLPLTSSGHMPRNKPPFAPCRQLPKLL